jgi:hypothetical protein
MVGLTDTTFNLSSHQRAVARTNEFRNAPGNSRRRIQVLKAAETGGEFSLPTVAEWSAI